MHAFKNRPLFDVELDIGLRICELLPGRFYVVETYSIPRERRGESVSVAVDQTLGVFEIEISRRGARAEEALSESRALLVGPIDEPHSNRRRPFGGDAAEHLEPRHHIQTSVEPSAVWNRVEVSADKQLIGGCPAERRPDVAGGICLHLDRKRLRFALEPLARPIPCLGPRYALRPFRVTGQRLQLAELRYRSPRL